jgi:hypothetical protein
MPDDSYMQKLAGTKEEGNSRIPGMKNDISEGSSVRGIHMQRSLTARILSGCRK